MYIRGNLSLEVPLRYGWYSGQGLGPAGRELCDEKPVAISRAQARLLRRLECPVLGSIENIERAGYYIYAGRDAEDGLSALRFKWPALRRLEVLNLLSYPSPDSSANL